MNPRAMLSLSQGIFPRRGIFCVHIKVFPVGFIRQSVNGIGNKEIQSVWSVKIIDQRNDRLCPGSMVGRWGISGTEDIIKARHEIK